MASSQEYDMGIARPRSEDSIHLNDEEDRARYRSGKAPLKLHVNDADTSAWNLLSPVSKHTGLSSWHREGELGGWVLIENLLLPVCQSTPSLTLLINQV